MFMLACEAYAKRTVIYSAAEPALCRKILQLLISENEMPGWAAEKRFIQESRKLNMAGVFVAQQKPSDKWLSNNLNQIVELEGAPAIQSAGAKIDVNAIKQARFTKPKPPANNLLMKFAVISQLIR